MSVTQQPRAEVVLVDYLRTVATDLPPFLHNQEISRTDCPYRPDILFHLINPRDNDAWVLIVEGDEWQHRGANYKNDDARMLVITQALRVPVHFIRFNTGPYAMDPLAD